MRSTVFIVGLAVLCGISKLDAATIVVSKAGAITSIQAGVDAAQAGDTVVVKAGTYFGVVFINAFKTNLVLKGQGKVVLDARALDGTALGAGIVVAASDVTVTGILVRHAADVVNNDGDGLRATGARLTLKKCTFIRCQRAGARVEGVDSLVTSCDVRAGGDGFDVLGGSGTRLIKCNVTRCLGDGVFIDGATDVVVDTCHFTVLAGDGVNVDDPADRLIVRKCEFRDLSGGGVDVDGAPDAIFENNQIQSCAFGFGLSANGAIVRNNKIASNTTSNEAIGIGNSDDVVVENNKMKDSLGSGVAVGSGGVNGTFRKNVAVRCGIASFAAFDIAGSGHIVDDCVTIGAGADGFEIDATTATITDCVAKDSAIDGFDVDNANATGVVLEDCIAVGNQAEGFENAGANTVLRDCVATNNRTDIANDGTFAEFDVVFATGGENTAPAID